MSVIQLMKGNNSMRASTFTKFGIGLVATALAASTLSPAIADPADSSTFGTLVGVGSDTTQDIMNGISTAVGGTGGLRIASYDAVGSEKITTRNGGTEIFRPNGSSNGRDVLRVAIGNSTTASLTVNNTPYSWTTADSLGQVDFARSSSGASAQVANGVLTYIPFALDAVTYATSEDSVIPNLTKGSSTDPIVNNVGEATLWSIYNGRVTKVVTDADGDYLKVVNNDYVAQAGETLTPIHALIPQAGSGTRSFWIQQVGITETQITQATVPVKDTYGEGLPVQEHNGAAVANDPGALVPFSIGQWVSQANELPGVTDRRNAAVLRSLNGQAPTSGAGTDFELNAGYTAITRKVYNIVPSALADDPNSKINWAFVGTGSLVCSQKDVIKAYGFGLLTGTGANACGDTTVRAFAPAASSVSVSTPVSSVKYGASFVATATVASNANGGGTVDFYNGEQKLGSVVLAANATVASLTVKSTTLDAVGAKSITAEFTPNLAGVAEATSDPLAVSIVKATPVVKGTAASVYARSYPIVKASVTATGFVPTGTVTVKRGTTTLKASVVLVDGKASVRLPKLSRGTHKLTVIYSGSAFANTAKSTYVTLIVK